ncbi:hypothetical protein ACIO3O_05650 [Streptomyces sp. NPDC087440]|uniref:hypothetical protein n=1 Tax=Streptomyces sp. NPDC087440 TaxID=3365790 RepID=UPI0037FBA321
MSPAKGRDDSFWNEETQSWDTRGQGRGQDRRGRTEPPVAPPSPPPVPPSPAPPAPPSYVSEPEASAPPGPYPPRPYSPEPEAPAPSDPYVPDSYTPDAYTPDPYAADPHRDPHRDPTPLYPYREPSPEGSSLPPLPPSSPGGTRGLPVGPAGFGRGRGQRVRLWALVVVLGLVVGGGTAWLLQRDTDKSPVVTASLSGRPASASGAPSDVPPPSAPETAGATDEATGSTGSTGTSAGTEVPAEPTAPADPALPAGFVRVEDSTGVVLAVPEDWRRSERGLKVVFYTPPNEPPASEAQRYLQFWPVLEPGYDSMDALRRTVKDHQGSRNYQQLFLGAKADPRLAESAELVYTYERDNGVRARVVERAFRAPDGQLYAFLVFSPADEAQEQYRVLTVALAHFDLADTP